MLNPYLKLDDFLAYNGECNNPLVDCLNEKDKEEYKFGKDLALPSSFMDTWKKLEPNKERQELKQEIGEIK